MELVSSVLLLSINSCQHTSLFVTVTTTRIHIQPLPPHTSVVFWITHFSSPLERSVLHREQRKCSWCQCKLRAVIQGYKKQTVMTIERDTLATTTLNNSLHSQASPTSSLWSLVVVCKNITSDQNQVAGECWEGLGIEANKLWREVVWLPTTLCCHYISYE